MVTQVGREGAEFFERRHLELASPLACHSQLVSHLDQRLGWLLRETEPQLEYEAKALVES
jgi:hypothetical protein